VKQRWTIFIADSNHCFARKRFQGGRSSNICFIIANQSITLMQKHLYVIVMAKSLSAKMKIKICIDLLIMVQFIFFDHYPRINFKLLNLKQ
jgi:hypothetical protein